jgi:hypothetical protein
MRRLSDFQPTAWQRFNRGISVTIRIDDRPVRVKKNLADSVVDLFVFDSGSLAELFRRGVNAHVSDQEWAADHSTREYRVRVSLPSEIPHYASDATDGVTCVPVSITIIRLSDHKKWVFAERTVRFTGRFENSDQYAIARLKGSVDAASAVAWLAAMLGAA